MNAVVYEPQNDGSVKTVKEGFMVVQEINVRAVAESVKKTQVFTERPGGTWSAWK